MAGRRDPASVVTPRCSTRRRDAPPCTSRCVSVVTPRCDRRFLRHSRLVTANVTHLRATRVGEPVVTMKWHDDTNNPLNGVSGLHVTVYNLDLSSGSHVCNLHTEEEASRCRDAGAEVLLDADGHPWSHEPSRVPHRSPEAIGVAKLPASASPMGVATGQSLCHRRHTSDRAVVARHTEGAPEGTGDGMRSSLIFRANERTGAQLQRGSEDAALRKAENRPPRKLLSMLRYLRLHLPRDNAHYEGGVSVIADGPLLPFTSDTAKRFAGPHSPVFPSVRGLSLYSPVFRARPPAAIPPSRPDGISEEGIALTLWRKYGITAKQLEAAWSWPINERSRRWIESKRKKAEQLLQPQPAPEGGAPDGVKQLAERLERQLAPRLEATPPAPEGPAKPPLSGAVHAALLSVVAPQHGACVDAAAVAALGCADCVEVRRPGGLGIRAASLHTSGREQEMAAEQQGASAALALLSLAVLAVGMVESTISDVLLLKACEGGAEKQTQTQLLAEAARDLRRGTDRPAMTPSGIAGLELGTAAVNHSLATLPHFQHASEGPRRRASAAATRAVLGHDFWGRLVAHAGTVDALAKGGESAMVALQQAVVDLKKRESKARTRKRRYRTGTLDFLWRLTGSSLVETLGSSCTWADAHTAIKAVVEGHGADDFMVHPQRRHHVPPSLAAPRRSRTAARYQVTKIVLNLVLCGCAPSGLDTAACPFGDGALAALWSLHALLVRHEYRLAAKFDRKEVGKSERDLPLVVAVLTEHLGGVAMAYWRSRLGADRRLAIVADEVEALVDRRHAAPTVEGLYCECLVRRAAGVAWARGKHDAATVSALPKGTFDNEGAIEEARRYTSSLLNGARVLGLTEQDKIVAATVASLVEARRAAAAAPRGPKRSASPPADERGGRRSRHRRESPRPRHPSHRSETALYSASE